MRRAGSVIVLVDRGAADVGGALVLLDVGLCPSSEGLEVAERGVAVVVGIPELEVGELRRSTHDGIPLGLA